LSEFWTFLSFYVYMQVFEVGKDSLLSGETVALFLWPEGADPLKRGNETACSSEVEEFLSNSCFRWSV
jgi:hypothetical protein